MGYKILHFADLHLDASFAGQGFPVEYGNERRLDLRAALTRILARARELKVDAITIGGDLFVQEYLLPETADFIQQQLALLAPMRVIIAPGAQDPYTNESPYARLNWPENVDIFYQGKLTQLELTPDIYLWGACNPPTRGQKLFENFQPAKGMNILLLHALRKANSGIHSINIEEAQKAGFLFALLGGEHVAQLPPGEKPFFVYPGSPEPLSPFEEAGLHHIVLIETDGKNLHIEPLSVQQWHYRAVEVDVNHCTSAAEAARRIDAALENEITATPHCAVHVVIKGKPDINLNSSALRPLVQATPFFSLENHFSMSYDLQKLAGEQTVRGLLVQRFLERIQSAENQAERQEQLTALNFALQALDGKQVNLYEIKTN